VVEHGGAYLEAIESFAEDARRLEVDFTSIVTAQEAVAFSPEEPNHTPSRRRNGRAHISALAANEVLKLPLRCIERVPKRNVEVLR
jgi:hypothetical protein